MDPLDSIQHESISDPIYIYYIFEIFATIIKWFLNISKWIFFSTDQSNTEDNGPYIYVYMPHKKGFKNWPFDVYLK